MLVFMMLMYTNTHPVLKLNCEPYTSLNSKNITEVGPNGSHKSCISETHVKFSELFSRSACKVSLISES